MDVRSFQPFNRVTYRSFLIPGALLAAVLLLGQGCAVQRPLCLDGSMRRAGCTRINELNNELSGKTVDVFCRDSSELSGSYVRFDRDSLLLISSETDTPLSLAAGDVERIVWSDHLGGILTGVFHGLLWGTVAPMPLLLKDDLRGGHPGGGVVIVYSALLGLVIGAADGAIEGQRYVYTIPADSSHVSQPP